MYIQNLNSKSVHPAWEPMVKQCNFTPEQTSQFVTGVTSFIASRIAHSMKRLIDVYKEERRRIDNNR